MKVTVGIQGSYAIKPFRYLMIALSELRAEAAARRADGIGADEAPFHLASCPSPHLETAFALERDQRDGFARERDRGAFKDRREPCLGTTEHCGKRETIGDEKLVGGNLADDGFLTAHRDGHDRRKQARESKHARNALPDSACAM